MNLKELIESRIEPTEPQSFIRDYFESRNGKPLTIRDTDNLNRNHPGYDSPFCWSITPHISPHQPREMPSGVNCSPIPR